MLAREPSPDDWSFLLTLGLDGSTCSELLASARRLGVAPQRLLFARGWTTPTAYIQALAAQFAVRAVFVPDDAASNDILIDATGSAPAVVAEAVAAALRLGREPVFFIGVADRDVEPADRIAGAAVKTAVEALRSTAPQWSAGCRMWLWQYIALTLTLGAVLGTAITAPVFAGQLCLMAAAAVFAVVALFRLLVTAAALLPPLLVRLNHQINGPAAPLLRDAELPTYSVLVPLFQEAAILPDLIEALSRLDYPPAKLDVALILEASDLETCKAAARASRPPHMRIIVVPNCQPRTKPKALNTALALTRGELVAVFDAEDIPAPRQLRRAASAFAAAPGRYACLQAGLAIYNPRQSWLTRQFALEYGALFHGVLPALIRLRLPVPLSGSSNHFPRHVLETASWDPFNVTEDADLGMRLTRQGGEIGLLECETREEAPSTFGQWLPQRTRWIKGWLQTYLVHTRRPWHLLRDLGLWRTAGFHILFGGFLVSVLSYPLMFVFLAIELRQPSPFHAAPGSLHQAALAIAVLDLAVAVLAAMALALIGAVRGGLVALAGHIAAAPLYWLLISVAGYRALIQFVWRPHLWEKTTHASRSRRPPRSGRSRS